MDNDEDTGLPKLSGGKFYMTPEGYNSLVREMLEQKAERHRTVEIVSWAAGNGDRSENADYKEGKRRLRQIDARMRFLQRRLANAEVVNPEAQTQRDRVFFGATLTYANMRDEEVTVSIVGVDEADMSKGLISIASPVSLAVLGKRVGDEVGVRTPRGIETIEILEISYPLCEQSWKLSRL